MSSIILTILIKVPPPLAVKSVVICGNLRSMTLYAYVMRDYSNVYLIFLKLYVKDWDKNYLFKREEILNNQFVEKKFSSY